MKPWIMVILALVVLCLAPVSVNADAARSAASQPERRAGLVVQFGDGRYIVHCISFHEESISGLDLLTRSGLDVATWGGAVCRIEREGCDYPTAPCFCQCQGSPCRYWSYWHWREDQWVYSQVGAADHRVYDGDTEGWIWGEGKPPQVVPLAQICPAVETPAMALQPPSVPTAALEPTGRLSLSASPTPGPMANPALTGKQSLPLGQYVAFIIMVMMLVGGFLLLRNRYRG